MRRKMTGAACCLVGLLWSATEAPAHGQSLLNQLGEQLRQTLKPAEKSEDLPPPRVVTGTPQPRGSLGVRVSPVTEPLIRDYELVVRKGAVITGIDKGSPADRAGLPLGGVIVAWNGERIDSPEDLLAAATATPPGRDVELTYYDRSRLARKRVHFGPPAPGTVASSPVEPVPLTGPNAPTPTPAPGSAPVPSTQLERALGAGGSRPVLGRIGRAIDQFATQAQTTGPVPPPEPTPATPPELAAGELADLKRQLQELSREVAVLRNQVKKLEQQVEKQGKR